MLNIRLHKKAEVKEAAIQAAILDYRTGRWPSIRASADFHRVHYSTLSRRLKGAQPRNLSHPDSQLLTPNQEDVLSDIILKLDDWGHPLKSAQVRSLAQYMQPSDTRQYPGSHWLPRFLNRHPTLASRLATRINRERASQDNPAVLAEFFDLVIVPLQNSGGSTSDAHTSKPRGQR